MKIRIKNAAQILRPEKGRLFKTEKAVAIRVDGLTEGIFLRRFIAQRVYTECTRINYIIVPVTNLNKY
jgi:hypothetical protein